MFWKNIWWTSFKMGSSLDSHTHSSWMIAQVGCITPTLSTIWSSFIASEESGMEEHKRVQSKGSIERGDEGWENESTWQQIGLQEKSTQISRASGVGGRDSSTFVELFDEVKAENHLWQQLCLTMIVKLHHWNVLSGVRMISRIMDSQICEEDTQIFHKKISNQFHLREIGM